MRHNETKLSLHRSLVLSASFIFRASYEPGLVYDEKWPKPLTDYFRVHKYHLISPSAKDTFWNRTVLAGAKSGRTG
jgi:hypothetical protein